MLYWTTSWRWLRGQFCAVCCCTGFDISNGHTHIDSWITLLTIYSCLQCVTGCDLLTFLFSPYPQEFLKQSTHGKMWNLDEIGKNQSVLTPQYFSSFLGWVVLDRCGRHFGLVLNFMRDGSVPLPESHRELEEVLKEAQYYRVQGLVQHCTSAMQVRPRLTQSKLSLSVKHWAECQ